VSTRLEFPLTGAGGEPVDLWRTLNSHGFVDLPPMRLLSEERALEVTVPVGRGRPRTVRVSEANRRSGQITVLGPAPGPATRERILAVVAHVLRLDADLSGFYAAAATDPQLRWVTAGAGRMVQSPTVFEDVAKTICTTNTTWSATERMVARLVEHLGAPATGAPTDGARGKAFPTPEAMAEADETFYRDVARTGYRGPYLRSLARSVVDGALPLEELGRASPDEVSDDELERQLLAIPGVGPYAAANVMMTLGRYSRLILDSWSRPAYAKIVRRKGLSDESIRRRFRRYGPFAGLAFWLVLTKDWV
jgi:3-methyladenine DNA glycosylase/8-oxoguanine DNA glycosylase